MWVQDAAAVAAVLASRLKVAIAATHHTTGVRPLAGHPYAAHQHVFFARTLSQPVSQQSVEGGSAEEVIRSHGVLEKTSSTSRGAVWTGSTCCAWRQAHICACLLLLSRL